MYACISLSLPLYRVSISYLEAGFSPRLEVRLNVAGVQVGDAHQEARPAEGPQLAEAEAHLEGSRTRPAHYSIIHLLSTPSAYYKTTRLLYLTFYHNQFYYLFLCILFLQSKLLDLVLLLLQYVAVEEPCLRIVLLSKIQ